MINVLSESTETLLLTDQSRLQEIYDLRVNVWGKYEMSKIVNRRLFPNGWYDEMDKTAFHWIMTNESDKIIAAARLNIFDTLESYSYVEDVKHLQLPTGKPFAFFSRLVVHPDYRGEARSFQFAECRLNFCIEKNIQWAQVFITNQRIMKLFENLGFYVAGKTSVNYHKSTFPHTVNVLIKEFY